MSTLAEQDTPAGRFNQPQQRATERRLSTPGFADEPERLARVNIERDAVHASDHSLSACHGPP